MVAGEGNINQKSVNKVKEEYGAKMEINCHEI